MNPLEIHKHVAQSSGREIGEVSPLAAELTILASQAQEVKIPNVVSAAEQGIAGRVEAEARKEAALEHAWVGLGKLGEYLWLSSGHGTNLTDQLGDLEILYDEDEQKAVITRSDRKPIQLFLNREHLNGILPLPPELNIDVLDCEGNSLVGISCFPDTLVRINCPENLLTALPPLPAGLVELRCQKNILGSLPDLPQGLNTLDCRSNEIFAFPNLPPSLEWLYATGNPLSDDEKEALRMQLPGVWI